MGQAELVDRFLRKVLHQVERNEGMTPQFVSSRWAAKEALVKATGRTDLLFHLIQVEKLSNGRPVFTLDPSESEKLQSIGVTATHLSLTHEEEYAVAVVVIEGKP